MAYEGELVKMENGRWARFQRCSIVNAGHQPTSSAGPVTLNAEPPTRKEAT